MITNNVLLRVFQISVGATVGTCFTIEVDGRQYIITAKHIAESVNASTAVRIYHEGQWKDIRLSLVGHCDREIDISVLVADFKLSPTHELNPSSAGLIYGQDVYFLGFPYSMGGLSGGLNRGFPFPFVKKAIISCMHNGVDVQIYYLDGHNNPGFSGGPVVFKPQNQRDFRIASVISGFKYTNEPVLSVEAESSLTYKYNTGIIISYNIKHAVDLVRENPIGYNLEA